MNMPAPRVSFPSRRTTAGAASRRITVPEIAQRLGIGRLKVYFMLEQRILPGVRVGRQWIVTRHAFDQWERTCGAGSDAGLGPKTELMVLN